MKSLRRLLAISVCLMALAPAAHGEVNLSELKQVVLSREASVPDRLEALESLGSELGQFDGEELVALCDTLLQLNLDYDQFASVAILKAKGFRNLRRLPEALAILDYALLEENSREFSRNTRFNLLYNRGGIHYRMVKPNRYKEALVDYQAALDLAEDMRDMDLQFKAHDVLGFVYNQLKDKPSAINHYTFILQYCDDEVQVAQARYNLSLQFTDDPVTRDTALAYMLRAREIFRRTGQDGKVGQATVSIAKNLRASGRIDEAILEFEAALESAISRNNRVTCYEYLGQSAADQERYEDAVALYDQGLRLDSENGYKRQVYISTKKGKALISLGRSREAMLLCDSMARMVMADEDLAEIWKATRLTDCWDCLGYAQKDLGMYEEAFASFVRKEEAEDSYRRTLEAEEAQLSMELYEFESVRAQEKQKVMDKQRDDQNSLLVVIVLLLIAFAIFITSRYRFTRKQSLLISTQRQQLQDRQRELIRANAELEIALNHKAVFLSNMSHEIRTPLNAIVGMSNLASKENMAETAKKYLRNIVIASSNLIDIVNDILDFSKLEAGKLEIAQEPFSVKDALEVAENVMRIPAEQKGLEFHVEAHPDLPGHLMGDSSRLNQVLINLIGNAIKFTLEGSVTMQAEVTSLPPLPSWCPPPGKPSKEWFVVRVRDTGIGIPEDKLEKIFESFNQGDQLKTRKFGGTGLGLSISKQIVELQGGVIWVESVEGEGSTFCFALPAQVSEGVAEADVAIEDSGEIGPLKILIAEDNPFNVIVTEDTLRSELQDLTIGKAENGRIAYEKVCEEDWDLVLMDVHMPEMSGLEATAAIRKLPDARSGTIIIAMTASVLREETDSYIRHGMDGFVPKPFQVEQLISEIRRLRSDRTKTGKTAVNLPPLRILIAEDNPFNVIVAEDTLVSEIPNVTIGKAENGRMAYEMVRDEEWDLVLMDIAMPEMTGLEATSAIRKLEDPAKAKTTIIAMTASVLKEETDHYLKKGMDGFVPKPFKVEQLLGEIQRAHLSRS